MLGKLLAAQHELEVQLKALRQADGAGHDTALVAECEARLGMLAALQDVLAGAKPAGLAAIRSTVLASVGAAATTAQQVRSAVASATAAGPMSLATTSAVLRQELSSLHGDLFERRIFDPFLHFASREDEEAYRRREEETRRYIAQQMAAKTPEGALNAAGATMGQMLDAHSHGAGASPEFLPRWTRLVETTQRHREALRAEGRDTTEFDRNLVASVRQYLRTKGLSELAIDAALAGGADPLDAVKPYLKSEKDAQALANPITMGAAEVEAKAVPITVAVVGTETGPPSAVLQQQAAAPHGVDDVMAKFRATGVVAAAAQSSSEFAHGVHRGAPGPQADAPSPPR